MVYYDLLKAYVSPATASIITPLTDLVAVNLAPISSSKHFRGLTPLQRCHLQTAEVQGLGCPTLETGCLQDDWRGFPL